MIPYSPLATSEPGADRAYLLGRTVFTAALIAMAALVLVMILFGMLNGGRVGPTGSGIWDVVVPWSAFTIPPWLVIALSVVPPVAAVVVAARGTWQRFSEMWFLGLATILLYVVVPIAFSRLYPTPDGPSFDPSYPQLGLNVHWWAALPQIVTIAVLIVGFVRIGIQRRRETSSRPTLGGTP